MSMKYVGKAYSEPGKSWHYSNTNYLVLGVLAESVMHEPLADQVRTGLADAGLDRPEPWEAMAARLVDAQAGSLANRLRRLAVRVAAAPDHHELVVAELGLLHLLARGGRRTFHLPGPLADAVRTAVGWTVRQATTGRAIRLETPTGIEDVLATGVDVVSGALMVTDLGRSGPERRVLAGEVVHVRMAGATDAPSATSASGPTAAARRLSTRLTKRLRV